MGSVVKNPPANTGDMSSIPESGRSPGEVNGNPLQYLSWKNPTDRGAWWATVHGVAESDMTEHTPIQAQMVLRKECYGKLGIKLEQRTRSVQRRSTWILIEGK